MNLNIKGNFQISITVPLRTKESLNFTIGSFKKSLKPLLSQHKIVKSLESMSWLFSKRLSETADGLHSTLYYISCHHRDTQINHYYEKQACALQSKTSILR